MRPAEETEHYELIVCELNWSNTADNLQGMTHSAGHYNSIRAELNKLPLMPSRCMDRAGSKDTIEPHVT